MAPDQELLSNVVSDFDILYRAYEQAGLLAEQPGTEAAKKLLGSGDDVYRFQRQFLLVDALLRNRVGRMLFGGDGLRHVAVFGGNNVGKSTVTNILAAEKLSSTSPEGGHTRHAQAFVAPSAEGSPRRLFGDNPFAFRRFKRISIKSLDKNRLDEFGVGTLSSGVLPADLVLWDMPDCDATESRRYMSAVVEAVAWADTVVYVTSVERYAVEHMVEWIFCLDSAGIGLVECINKTRRKDIGTVIENQKTTHFPRMARKLALAAPDPPIVGLRYLTEGEEEDLWGPDHPEAGLLRNASLEMLSKSSHSEAGLKALGFALRSVDDLVEPAKMEALAKEQWATAVDGAVKDFVSVYERQYLRSDKVIEPFTRLNLEILRLLDPQLPGLNEALQALRWITRWPAKLVLAAGRRVVKIALNGNQDAQQQEKLAPEFKAYADAHKVVLNRLGALIDSVTNSPRHHPFWNALSAAWTEELEPLSQHLGKLVERHMTETDNGIKTAARDIRAKLEDHPVLLNTLRGARVTANVTGALVGFLVPVKGGIVYDLIEELLLAPAIVGSVEAATTGAVEGFVSNCKHELVEKLMHDARTIGAQLYREPLQTIADAAMQKTGTLGISKDVVERLPAALRQLHNRLAGSG
jgi:hypothetical protein